jgi:hypothetical protein
LRVLELAEPVLTTFGKDDVVGTAGGAAVDSVAARVSGVASLTIFGKGDVASPAGGAAGDCVAAGATGVASPVPGTATGDVLTTGMTADAPLVTGRLLFAGLLAPTLVALVLSVVGGGDEAGVVLTADVAGVVVTVVVWVSEAGVVERVTVLEADTDTDVAVVDVTGVAVLDVTDVAVVDVTGVAVVDVAVVDVTGVVKVVEQSSNRLAWTKIN